MPFPLKKIKDLKQQDLANKRVLIRADLNVPFENGQISDDFRIKKFLPTLDFLLANNARVLILAHLTDDQATLEPVFNYLKAKYDIAFVKNLEDLGHQENNSVLLLENLRFFPEEKKNDEVFAKKLANLADLYINEAFSASHRPHASIVSLPKLLPAFIGPLFESEILNLEKIINPKKPFIAILGGKKAETKIPLIEKMLEKADQVFVGGALANDFLLAGGKEIGRSVNSGSNLIKKDWFSNSKLCLPNDFVLEDEKGYTRVSSEILKNEKIVDVDLSFIRRIGESLNSAKTIFWNGSMGFCEGGFKNGTLELIKIITKSEAFSVVGGGDSVSAIKEFGFENDFDFISTGGGASLEFIALGTLPGIDALLE